MESKSLQIYSISSLTTTFPLRFYLVIVKMAENLRRAVQDINLGFDDAPMTIPPNIVANAMAENRFILMGRPVMPRRQNLRSIIASMPRVWGQSGLVHGRIIGGNQFQFIFPSEESLSTVLRRGPWAFNDRMLVLQRWFPDNAPLINFIPFWVQVRGIPFHFLNRDVISHIGRSLGPLLDVDYDGEAAARVEFVRVQISWDIQLPLRFQRHIQFQEGVNTLLRFRYERLRGFCEVCGLLTHDTGACVLPDDVEQQFANDEEDDEHPPPEIRQNQGVVIREIVEPEPVLDAAVNADEDVALDDIDPYHDALAHIEDLPEEIAVDPLADFATNPWIRPRLDLSPHPDDTVMLPSM
ncbi:uncharacterized protein LOC111830187 [Capsella rubella]|uniref:uncharacterized protein LOC111830187 n=1 Tax=Capsella rubella TaxID=81985 RepID=UPI000CD58369|nr:uncharacterized protein LOC111830187 [Capsella rubella]